MSTRRGRDEKNIIRFSARSKPPYNYLSNFYGRAEHHFMAARFKHTQLKSVIVNEFATCSAEQFCEFFTALHPRGKPSTYMRKQEDGSTAIARGMLARLVGTAVIKNSYTANNRMTAFRKLAGVAEDEVIETNTEDIYREAGLTEEASELEQVAAIDEYNETLMKDCLRDKFREGHVEDGINFRELLLSTGDRRLREATGFGGGRWAGRGEDDGLLGRMLVELREEIRQERASPLVSHMRNTAHGLTLD